MLIEVREQLLCEVIVVRQCPIPTLVWQVVLKEGAEATEEEIVALCKENLASYKKPKSVEFRKTLPRTTTGKIRKKDIRDEFWKGKDRKV